MAPVCNINYKVFALVKSRVQEKSQIHDREEMTNRKGGTPLLLF